MILLKILPGVLKELTRHVPTVFFQVVVWSEIASEVPKFSKRVLQKDGFVDFFEKQKKFLSPLPISISAGFNQSKHQNFERETGIRLLEIYFAQIFSPHGIYLDLRAHHFSVSKDEFIWYPTGAWTVFDEPFRLGLLKVYEGFYCGREDVYRQGLTEVGLMAPDWSATDKDRLANLFKEQFGDAQTEEVSFSLENFNRSMSKTFNFILSKKRNITRDFLYLGIYLVTLYSSLEKTGHPLPVKDVYLRMRKQFGHGL